MLCFSIFIIQEKRQIRNTNNTKSYFNLCIKQSLAYPNKKRRIRAILRSNPALFGFLFCAYFSRPAFWHAGQMPSKIILCRVIRYPDSAAIVLSGVGSYENGASQTAPQSVQIR